MNNQTVNLLFVGSWTAALLVLYAVAFRYLPREEWQFLAAVPVKKLPDGRWQSRNLTWYGVLLSFSLVAAVALFIVLVRSAEVPPVGIFLFIGVLISVSTPFAKIIARVVEKRKGTLTIGGAVFVGLLVAPPLALILEQLFPHSALTSASLGRSMGNLGMGAPVSYGNGQGAGLHAPLLAAVVTAYALGEGIGRLACLSFGCCYGKRLSECPLPLRRLFGRVPIVLRGKTKKAAYAGNLEGEKLFPIQAITAVFYTLIAAASSLLFLFGEFRAAFLTSATGTLGWRFFSEFLRSDYRGGSASISAYQWMSLFGACYATMASFVLPFPSVAAGDSLDVLQGLHALLDWRVILGLQGLFVAIFLYSGVSVVTESKIEFRVRI